MSRRFAARAGLFALVLLVPAGVGAQGSRGGGGHPAQHAAPTRAVLPGFEELDDGSTRLFVDLTAPAAYETRTGKGSLTYILKGTQVAKRNNCNPLVTVFFNTPVTRAQLVPHGGDLWFVVDVRAPAPPSVSVDAKAEGGATLSIRFPKGDYLPAKAPADAMTVSGNDVAASPTPSASAAPSAVPTSRPHAGGGGGHSHGHGGGASAH